MDESLSRREFLQVSSAAAWAAGAVPLSGRSATPAPSPFRGTFCLFSKPVPQLSWQELARSAKRAGFGGIDLTVRKDGHVSPANVVEDLPKAAAAIRGEGMEVSMLTTELLSADDPAAIPILSTAAKLSIPVIKLEYEIDGVSDNQGRALSRDKCHVVMESAAKDLATLKSLVHEAYEAA